MKKVYVAAFTTQDRDFDECGRGYLPLFNPVLGVYEDLWDAIKAVCKFLYTDHKEFEVLDDTSCVDEKGNIIGWEYNFNYKDKNTSASAYYEIQIIAEYITPKRNSYDTLQSRATPR